MRPFFLQGGFIGARKAGRSCTAHAREAWRELLREAWRELLREACKELLRDSLEGAVAGSLQGTAARQPGGSCCADSVRRQKLRDCAGLSATICAGGSCAENHWREAGQGSQVVAGNLQQQVL